MLSIIKKERIVFMSVFIVSAGLVLLDRLTAFDITKNIILFILLYIAICALLLMICQYLFGELSKKFIWLLFVLIFCACFGMALLTWRTDWKTQTVIFRNIENPNQTIEYRMRENRFGIGYDRQIVRRKKIFPFLDNVKGIDTATIDESKWIMVNERINEMGFPGEYVDLPFNNNVSP